MEFLGCSKTHTRPQASARYMRMQVLSYPEIRKGPRKESTTTLFCSIAVNAWNLEQTRQTRQI